MYNKREIMMRAHELRKAGQDMSQSLKKAWVEAKIAAIDYKLHSYNMIDFQSKSDKEAIRELGAERDRLNSIINPAVEIERTPNTSLSFFEEAEIRGKLAKIRTSLNPDWNEYKELESRLFVA